MADISVWLVKAEESCDSSGGGVTLLIVSKSDCLVPDIEAAFRRTRQRESCELYQINSIRCLGMFDVEGFLLVDADDE